MSASSLLNPTTGKVLPQYLPNPYPFPAPPGPPAPAPALSAVLAVGNTTAGQTINFQGISKGSIQAVNELDTETLKVEFIKSLDPLFPDVGVEANLVFPGDINLRNNALGAGDKLIIDSVPASVAPVANVLAYDTVTNEITYQPTSVPGGETLAQTLALGNTSGSNDIVMDTNQKIDVATIVNTKSITGSSGAITVRATSSAQQALKLDTITREANLTGLNGTLIGQHYTNVSTANNSVCGLRLANSQFGTNRTVEVGSDFNSVGTLYTRMAGLTPPSGNPLGRVLVQDGTDNNIYIQDITVERNQVIEGDFTIQDIVPAVPNVNEADFIVNNGINAGVVSQSLTTVGDPAYIPFFSKDGTPYPTNVIADNGTPFPTHPPVPTGGGGFITCMATDQYSGIVYSAYNIASRTVIYRFVPNDNQWSQWVRVRGIAYAMIIDGNNLYIGGNFTETESVNNLGTVNSCQNIVRLENNTVLQSMGALGTGLNNAVHCLAKWNGYIAIGGKFDREISSIDVVERIALFQLSTNLFFNINQGTGISNGEWGFNDSVFSLAVAPQTSELVIGGTFTQVYQNNAFININYLVRFSLSQSFNTVGDNSLNGLGVFNMLADYDSGFLYIGGDFNTSQGYTNFTAVPINSLGFNYINLGYNAGRISNGTGSGSSFNLLAKDEIGGYIWILEDNGSILRYDPNVNTSLAYYDVGGATGLLNGTSVIYSFFDKSIHLAINTAQNYYRYYCDQRIKFKSINGDLFVLDGAEYDTMVLPKRGSTVSIRGGILYPGGKRYVFGASPGVYGEWATGQITQPEPAYGVYLITTTLSNPPSGNFSFDTVIGKNITSGSPGSTKLTVKQKGLYKISYRVQARTTAFTSDLALYFRANSMFSEQTTTYTVLQQGIDYEYYNEVFMFLGVNEEFRFGFNSGQGDIDFISGVATPQQPSRPAVMVKVELILPQREAFI